jgi:hypothetical protein
MPHPRSPRAQNSSVIEPMKAGRRSTESVAIANMITWIRKIS